MVFLPRVSCVGLMAFFLCLLPALALASASKAPITVSPGQGIHPVGPHLELLEDVDKAWTITDITSERLQGFFHPSTSAAPSFGFTSSAFWARFTVTNSLPQATEYFLEIEYPLLDRIDLFAPRAAGGFQVLAGGDTLPFQAREIHYRNPLLPVPLEPGIPQTFYLRVESASSITLPLTLLSPARLAERISAEQMVLGIYYGALLILILYNLFIYVGVRDTAFLAFALFATCYLLFQLSINGLAMAYLWPDLKWLANHSTPLTLFASYFFAVIFTRALLDTPRCSPRLDKLLLLLMNLALFGFLGTFLVDYSISIRFGILFSVTMFFLLTAGVLAALKNNHSARYYLAAWLVGLVGFIAYALKTVGIIPHTFISHWGIQIGSAGQMILLSIGLADRFSLIKKEKERLQIDYAAQLQAANQELARFNEELEAQVDDRTRELSRLNSELRQEVEERRHAEQQAGAANRAKSQFLANMSHEIRTPLNAILGMANLAAKQELSPKTRQYVGIIKDSGDSLLGLINDILDFSKIEAGKLDMEEVNFDLQEVLDSVADMFSRKMAEKDIELIITTADNVPNALVGDPLRLKQILVNLTNNAIKFTVQGEIVISIHRLAATVDQATLEFLVKDSGSGINHDQIKKLFGEYTQAESSTARLFGGTGLGLAISKRLVLMMEGDITASSEPEKGSTFRFTVKLATQHPDMQQRFLLPDTVKSKRLLVVEPNETLCSTLVTTLKGLGCEAQPCLSAAEARESLAGANAAFDGLLLNWRLPDGNGLDLFREIKKQRDHSDIAVIMMAPIGFDALLAEAEQHGLTSFLIKPVKLSYLFQALLDLFAPGARRASAASPVQLDATCAADRQYFRGARVLVVEDDSVNQEVTRKLLLNRGIFVDVAGNGLMAVKALKQREYDAVLMDVQMPEMDGFIATRNIRAQERLRKLPIIAMTAHAMKGDKEKCIEAGMNDYIHKPLDFDLLFTTLRKWINPPSQRQ